MAQSGGCPQEALGSVQYIVEDCGLCLTHRTENLLCLTDWTENLACLGTQKSILIACCPSNKVSLRDRSAQTTLCVTTPRQKSHIALAIPSHSILASVQTVLVCAMLCQVSGWINTGIPV